MLSGIILVVFVLCYCCHRNGRKPETNLPYYWRDPTMALEVYTVETGQQVKMFLEQKIKLSCSFINFLFYLVMLNFLVQNTFYSLFATAHRCCAAYARYYKLQLQLLFIRWCHISYVCFNTACFLSRMRNAHPQRFSYSLIDGAALLTINYVILVFYKWRTAGGGVSTNGITATAAAVWRGDSCRCGRNKRLIFTAVRCGELCSSRWYGIAVVWGGDKVK